MIRSAASMPEPSGMCTSSSTTSGSDVLRALEGFAAGRHLGDDGVAECAKQIDEQRSRVVVVLGDRARGCVQQILSSEQSDHGREEAPAVNSGQPSPATCASNSDVRNGFRRMKSPSAPAPARGSHPVTTPMRIDGHRSRANEMRSHPLPSDKPMSVTSTSYAGLALLQTASSRPAMPARRYRP